MSRLSEHVRGVVFHDNKIVFLEDNHAYTPEVKKDALFNLIAGSYYIPLSVTEFKRLRDQCLRDTLVYENNRKLYPRQWTEHDFPLTPERPVGRIEGVSEPSSDPAEQAWPRDPDTSGSET
jgi:hypothetical protein